MQQYPYNRFQPGQQNPRPINGNQYQSWGGPGYGAPRPEGGNKGGGKRPDQVQRRRRRRPLLGVFLVLIAIALISGGLYIYSQYSRVRPYENVFLPNISIDGIDLSGKTYDEAKNILYSDLAQRQNSWSLSLTYQGHTFSTLNYALMGISTDTAQVDSLLEQAYSVGHEYGTMAVFERNKTLTRQLETPLVLYTTQTEMTDANVNDILSQIADYFKKSPVDAALTSFNPDAADPFVIQAESYGSSLNTEPIKQEILERAARGESGTLEIVPDSIAPAVVTEDIRAQVTLLSTGITAISKASEEGRTNNIKLAFQKINGLVLEPGKTFSFNTVVGTRTKANGFFEAPEYAYGDLVTGIGGGVCQASTTVYLAAVTSNMTITKRTKHSMPVNYTEMGQDATVSDGRLDFKFVNSTDGRIYITAHVEKVSGTKNRYQCVVRIYGKTLGENVLYKLRSVTTQTIEPGEPVYKKDTKGTYVTYEDETYKYQSSRKGYVVETYLQRWENGKMVQEQLITTDTYEPRAEGYYVGVRKRE